MSPIQPAPVEAGAARTPSAPETNAKAGAAAAVAAYTLWGFLPLFFKLIESVDALTIVANRVVFSLLAVLGFVSARGAWGEVRRAFRDRRVVLAMLASTLLIAVNWLTFIYGVTNAHVLEVSFGYFINPLVSVAIGLAFLGERFTRLQTASIVLALVAVAIQWIGLGTFPWVALVLALSFGFYGYVRKVAAVGSAAGLFVETLFLLPVALAYLAWMWTGPMPDLYSDPMETVLLVCTGPLTAIPLVLFAFAARQLKLSTIGMFQYLAPSLQFALAVFVFDEPLSAARLASFVLIWVSIGLFTAEGFLTRKRAG